MVAVRVRRWRTAVGLVAVAAMALPTFDKVRLFPYNYVHYGAIADMVGVVPESDYWRTSVRELAPAIPPSGRVMCSPYIVAAAPVATPSTETKAAVMIASGRLRPTTI